LRVKKPKPGEGEASQNGNTLTKGELSYPITIKKSEILWRIPGGDARYLTPGVKRVKNRTPERTQAVPYNQRGKGKQERLGPLRRVRVPA